MNCSLTSVILVVQDGRTSFDLASLEGNMDVCQELTAGMTGLVN